MGGPKLPNLDAIIQAGFDPKTRMPIKMFGGLKSNLKPDIKKMLRLIDEQDAINRYVWELPEKLCMTSQEFERILYYKGQVCFFYIKDVDKYALLPYALNDSIDMYGRFKYVTPIPFFGGAEEEKKYKNTPIATYLASLKLKCVYSLEDNTEDSDNCCVLLNDYSKQLSQNIIPRQLVNDPLLDVMSECIPFMRTKLILGTGVKGIRVADADQSYSVIEGAQRLEAAAIQGEAFVPVVGPVEMQELASDSASKSEEYMLAMKSLDNFRLSTYGIANGGLFEKKAHELQTEADINGATDNLIIQDGLKLRERFCELVKKVYGIEISVRVNDIAPKEEDVAEGDMEEGESEDETYDDTEI